MKYKYVLIVSICCFFAESIYGERLQGEINRLLGAYRRPLTVLEMGDIDEGLRIAQQYARASVVIVSLDADAVSSAIKNGVPSNVILTNPERFGVQEIQDLGACEHFDVVIAHRTDVPVQQFHVAQAVLSLGDFAFMEVGNTIFPSLSPRATRTFYAGRQLWSFFETPKKKLQRSCWVRLKKNEKKPQTYFIESNFNSKKLRKEPENTTSAWINGINLVSFIMLRGMYPTDSMIRRDLKSFFGIEHNDLVISNFVVQGENLAPIDFRDSRRSISTTVCLKAIRAFFKKGKRMNDPQGSLSYYLRKLDRYRKSERS